MITLEQGLQKPVVNAVLTSDTNYDFFVPANCDIHIQTNWDSAEGTKDGIVSLRSSLDFVNFANLAGGGMQFTIDSASGVHTFDLESKARTGFRLTYTENSLTTINLNIIVSIKEKGL